MKRKKLLKKWAKQTKKNQRLIKELADAKALNQFYAIWTHELRSPLSVAEVTLAELKTHHLVQNNHASDHQAWWLLESAMQQVSMSVNDLLGLAQVANQRLIIQRQPFNLQSVLHELEAMSLKLLGDKAIKLVFQPVDADVWLNGDAFRLKQILLNLLANAIKFTQQGQVALNWQPDSKGVRFQVQDTGPGLSASQQAHLFKPFHQLLQSQAGETIGSGLGLFIVQSLVRAMQGQLQLESEVGKGTRFTVHLPWLEGGENANQATSLTQDKVSEASQIRVLLADDSALSRRLLINQLTHPNIDWVEAEDGEQALHLLQNQTFDYVILDSFMPKLNGDQLCQNIRQFQMDGQQVNLKGLFLISAEPAVLDQLNPCFDYCLIKPVDPVQLIKRFGLSMSPASENPKKDDCKNFIHDKIPSDLTEMLPEFIREVEYLLAELELCLRTSQYETCRDWIHRLKGSCMLFQQNAWLVDIESLETAIQQELPQDALERLHKIRSHVVQLQATCEL